MENKRNQLTLRSPVCVECLIGKQKKPILFKVTEPSSVPYSHGFTKTIIQQNIHSRSCTLLTCHYRFTDFTDLKPVQKLMMIESLDCACASSATDANSFVTGTAVMNTHRQLAHPWITALSHIGKALRARSLTCSPLARAQVA